MTGPDCTQGINFSFIQRDVTAVTDFSNATVLRACFAVVGIQRMLNINH